MGFRCERTAAQVLKTSINSAGLIRSLITVWSLERKTREQKVPHLLITGELPV